jgi:hypothetical protein
MLRTILVGISFVAVTFLSATAIAEDAVSVDPQHYTVEFENDRVRIIRIKYGPGEKSVMHTHGPNVTVFLTDASVRMKLPDGTIEDATGKAGEAGWSDAEGHSPENLSDQPIEAILIEVKDKD